MDQPSIENQDSLIVIDHAESSLDMGNVLEEVEVVEAYSNNPKSQRKQPEMLIENSQEEFKGSLDFYNDSQRKTIGPYQSIQTQNTDSFGIVGHEYKESQAYKIKAHNTTRSDEGEDGEGHNWDGSIQGKGKEDNKD